MAILIADMQSGVAGDMLVAAALDLGIDEALFRKQLSTLPLEFQIDVDEIQRGGIRARTFNVRYPRQHNHRHLSQILDIIEKSGLPAGVKEKAGRIFSRLAAAEAKVHGTGVEQVHFHEVGAVDAIVDITGAALAFSLLDADKVYCSPFIHGYGQIKTEHGILGVPAPATVELTLGFPSRRVEIEGELTTPTGAAILTALGRPLAELGPHAAVRTGYGAGTKEFPGLPNALRLILAEPGPSLPGDSVIELETNLDDATGEILGRAFERLMQAGALDVFMVPVTMKKQRPGVLLTVLCKPEARERLSRILLVETGSIGCRYSEKRRICLDRESGTVATPFGEIKVKIVDFFGTRRATPEYESCREAAEKAGVPLWKIYAAVEAASGNGA